jgi:hypothetical protein
LAGEILGRIGGVGDGEGFCSRAALSPLNSDATGTVDVCLPEPPANGARELLASTKLLNNNAVLQTPTHFLTAANFRGLLSIYSLLRDSWKPPATRSLEMPLKTNIQSARRTVRSVQFKLSSASESGVASFALSDCSHG